MDVSLTYDRWKAILFSVVIVLGAFVFVLGPGPFQVVKPVKASPDCIPCPGGGRCEPNCGGGGCPKGTVSISASAAAKATEAWINWTTSPSSTDTLVWGNTTSYGFTAVSSSSGSSWHIFLDYLEPSTTYYYHITASASCYNTGSKSGSFTTGSDSLTIISGTVYDAQHPTETAPSYGYVTVWCVHDPNAWYTGTFLNDYGQYSLDVAGANCGQYGSGGAAAYVVSFGYDSADLGSAWTGNWMGHWNETIVVWAPQVVNFYLLENFLGPTLVNYGLFTNSADVTLEFCQETTNSFSYETSSSETVGAFGLSGTYDSSVQVGGSFGSTLCSSTVGEPSDEEWGSWETTGMILVNNIGKRAVTDLWQQYYGGKYGGGLGSGGPLANPVSEPTSNASACFTSEVHWYKQNIGRGSQEYIQIGASGTISQLGSDTFSFNLGSLLAPLVDVPGIGEVASTISSTITASSTWGYSWSTSQTDQFYVSAYIQAGSTSGTFTVACQGSGTSGQGLAMEVWQDS